MTEAPSPTTSSTTNDSLDFDMLYKALNNANSKCTEGLELAKTKWGGAMFILPLTEVQQSIFECQRALSMMRIKGGTGE